MMLVNLLQKCMKSIWPELVTILHFLLYNESDQFQELTDQANSLKI